jgi:hypothetical protein
LTASIRYHFEPDTALPAQVVLQLLPETVATTRTDTPEPSVVLRVALVLALVRRFTSAHAVTSVVFGVAVGAGVAVAVGAGVGAGRTDGPPTVYRHAKYTRALPATPDVPHPNRSYEPSSTERCVEELMKLRWAVPMVFVVVVDPPLQLAPLMSQPVWYVIEAVPALL